MSDVLPPLYVVGLPNMRSDTPSDTLPAHCAALVSQAHCLAAPHSLLHHAHDGQERFVLDGALLRTMDILAQRRQQGKSVVVLVHGDPLYFGVAASFVRRLGADAVCVVPGVSIVQRVCGYVGFSWEQVRHVSLHGRHEQGHWLPLFHALLANAPTCLLTDKRACPATVAQRLVERGAADRDVHIFSQWGSDNEMYLKTTLFACAKETTQYAQPCTVLLMPSSAPRRLSLGLTAVDVQHESALMTKLPVRATALSLLRLLPHHTLWDVGSGSGALALEASSLVYEGRCVAIEHNGERVAHIQANRAVFGALNMDICHGKAPSCLAGLPEPQRIFVGGGLLRDTDNVLLRHLAQALAPKGRMVISCTLLGSLQKAHHFFSEQNWAHETTHILAAQSATLANDCRLVPHNPVFLVFAEKS